MSFFAELKRRNVFKVGVAYAIVAWLIVQVISAVHNPLHLPDWFDTVVIVLLIIGFILAIILAWAYELTPEGIKTTTAEGPAQYHTRTTGQRLNYFILGVLLVLVSFVLVDNYVLVDRPRTTVASVADMTPVSGKPEAAPGQTSPAPVSASTPELIHRASLILDPTQPLGASLLDAYIALSRDGRHLVYAAQVDGIGRLYVRELDQLTARPIPGTEGAFDACFSPDGEWVVYEAGGSGLYKVAVTGGPPQQLVDRADLPRGAWWSPDNIIYFTINGKLQRIDANGGKPEPVKLQSEYANWFQAWPSGLPGGTHLLLTVHQNAANAKDGNTVLLDLKTGKTRLLMRNAFNARYVPTGHIVFMRSGSLWAVPFDAGQLKITGPEVPVVNGVESSGGLGQAIYAFSNDGWLIYLPGGDVQGGGAASTVRQLVWVDRHGKVTPVDVKPNQFNSPRLSPDDRQVALTIEATGASQDIWVLDLTRGTLSKRSFSGGAFGPLWSPDGKYLAYSFFPNIQGMAWTRADGAGQPEKLLDAPRLTIPTSFSPDGAQLIYTEAITASNSIHVLSMNKDHTDRPLLTKNANGRGVLSPDGKWLAYESLETGRREIYVRPYPDVDNGKWQISTEGGADPHWRGDGKALFYLSPGSSVAMMAVSIDTNSGFQAGEPVKLFQGDFYYNSGALTVYDVTTDGQRFLMMKAVEKAGENKEPTTKPTNLVVEYNWFNELKRLAPPAK